MTVAPPRREHALDGLRGIAALMVFFNHVAMMTWYPRPGERGPQGVEYAFWHLGAPAVDLFFVLSGYVLCASLERVRMDGPALGAFLARRWVRLMPVAWTGILLGLAVKQWVVPLQQGPLLGMAHMDQPLRWQEILGTITFSVPMPDTERFNVPLWTLVMEMYASLLIPVTVMGLRAQGRFFLMPAFLSWVLLWQVSGRLEFMTLPLFVLGVAVRTYVPDLPRRSVHVALAIGCTLFLSRYLVGAYEPWHRYVSGIGAAAIILAVHAGAGKGLLTSAPVAWLGRISYPFYAVHYPLVLAGTIVLSARGVQANLAGALSLPVALVLADIVQRTVERASIDVSRRVGAGRLGRAEP
jgi:peptidoglycan/LPS O-acetylase OafA/YrhL